MLTRGLFLLIFVMAAATNFLAGASTARAADVSCSGTLGGGATVTNINGNVKVPDNASCTLNFVNVTGNVQAGHGSTLLITAYTEPSTIGGNVQAEQCKSALLRRQCHGWRQCADPTVHRGRTERLSRARHCHQRQFPVPGQCIECHALPGVARQGPRQRADTNPIHPRRRPDVSLVTIGGNLHCQHNSPATTHMHGPSWVDGHSQECNAPALPRRARRSATGRLRQWRPALILRRCPLRAFQCPTR